MSKPSKTFVTFAVTFELEKGLSIKEARGEIVRLVKDNYPQHEASVKVHLLNKEVKYG